jgi:anaerobic dimethyl sulfoxide reductase subunit B (iron-sulfur subunit)
MQMGFYFDQTRCTGCYTCVVACKNWHDIPTGPASWRKVINIEKGKFPDLFVAFLSISCNHCADPACIKFCPSQAIIKRREDGIVVVDRQECLGKDQCALCLQVCPYQAPQFGPEPNAKMQKCNFCMDRQYEGQKPICVTACPMQALDAGPLEELEKKYGQGRCAEGFTYDFGTRPSIILKLKHDIATTTCQGKL